MIDFKRASRDPRYTWEWNDHPSAPQSLFGYVATRVPKEDVRAFAAEQLGSHPGELVPNVEDELVSIVGNVKAAEIARFIYDFGTTRLFYTASVTHTIIHDQYLSEGLPILLGQPPAVRISFEPQTAIAIELLKSPVDETQWTDDVAKTYDAQFRLLERETLKLAYEFAKQTGAIFVDFGGYGVYRESELKEMVELGLQRYDTWAWKVGMAWGATVERAERESMELKILRARMETLNKRSARSPLPWPFGKRNAQT